jgi:hypothetical protein
MLGDFLAGANLPWVNYGVDFGANAWRPEGGVGEQVTRELLDRELQILAASGVSAVRWFLFCDGRAGIRFDWRGRPAGLDDFVFRDMDSALESLQRHRLRVMWVLIDFHWCRPARTVRGVRMGGRAGSLRRQGTRRRLLDSVLRPVLERYGRASAVLAWDVMNEPEWIGADSVRPFLLEAISLAHSCASQPVTIGSAGLSWRSWYRDLGLDFYQVHWYDALQDQPPLDTQVAALGFDRPVVLGEFPTRGSRRSAEGILETARAAGYAGAFYWSALSHDAASDPTRRPPGGAGSLLPQQSSANLAQPRPPWQS